METFHKPNQTIGLTYTSKIDDGMEIYAKEKGFFRASSSNVSSLSYDDYKDQINLNRPNVLSFMEQDFYCPEPDTGHSVTGVGFKEYIYGDSSDGHQYMMVHDNWGSTPRKVYVTYGRNYKSVTMSTFQPN